MAPDRHSETERIYHDALERRAADREAFIVEACAGDEALRREVVSLLAHEERAERFLSTPAFEMTVRAVAGTARLLDGQRLGPYIVASRIGVGGMGEVYRASDSRLGRSVALKIMSPAFAEDPDRLARFKREAQVLASLNHPNIAAIYGLEEADGVQALVLELVEGPTLAEQTAKGPLALSDALPIARQVCDALEAAHGQGIIHRDLKPANIKVRPDGTVKVLDFGLAKAWEPRSGGAVDLSNSPTIPGTAETAAGIILGTAAYMSPEQAKGRPVDKRSDVWAFGCVVYEMLTGANPFPGEDVPDTLSLVLRSDPDWTALPPETPEPIRRLLRRCLDKDRARRLADISDARIEIEEAAAASEAIVSAPPGEGSGTRWIRAVPWTVAAIAALVSVIAVVRTVARGSSSAPRSVTRLEFNLPATVEFYVNAGRNLALSPDGTRLAFVGILGGIRQLYVRRLDQFEAVPVKGTENANSCFFSPDGTALGFISSDRTLKKVSLADGLLIPLARDVDFGGGAWGPDDRITFVRAGALWQIPASGGESRPLTTLESGKGEVSEAWPTAVAGGRAILFAAVTGSRRDASRIEAVTVSTGRRDVVLESGTFPLYAATGHLVFFRGGSMLAAPFDIDRLITTGSPIRVLDNFPLDTTSGAPLMALSESGALVYPPIGASTSRLVWVSRQGLEQPITDTYRAYQAPRLSPDGRRIVVQSGGDLWVQDTARPSFMRLTSDETVGNSYPVWTVDGARVVFRTRTGLRWIDANGGRSSQPIPGTAVTDFPSSISPDGKLLAVSRITADMSSNVDVLQLDGNAQPIQLVRTAGFDGGAQFSPDGRSIAYASDDSGVMQVYVRPFPGPERKWQVSTDGGTAPRWNRNGKELFYRNGNKMMAVDVSVGSDPTSSPPRLLFDQRYAFGANVTLANYDVSADGQRFVMVKDDPGSSRLNIVLNWFDELSRLESSPAR